MGWGAWTAAIVGTLVGVGVFVAGLRLAAGARGSVRGRAAAEPGSELGRGLGHPQTRLTVGLVLAVAGYHAVAWSLPTGWVPLRVPIERWWVLALALGAGVGLTLLADRIERRGDEDGDGAGGG